MCCLSLRRLAIRNERQIVLFVGLMFMTNFTIMKTFHLYLLYVSLSGALLCSDHD